MQNTTGQLFQENGSGQCMIKPVVILVTFDFGSDDQTKFRQICHELGKKYKKKGLINGILIQVMYMLQYILGYKTGVCPSKITANLGPVVQSIVSLKSLLRGQLFKCFTTS